MEAIDDWFNKNIFKKYDYKPLPMNFFESAGKKNIITLYNQNKTLVELDLDKVYKCSKAKYEWGHEEIISDSYEELDSKLPGNQFIGYHPLGSTPNIEEDEVY